MKTGCLTFEPIHYRTCSSVWGGCTPATGRYNLNSPGWWPKGLTAEFLKGDPEMVELDRYMRRYNLWGDSKYQAECLRPETEELVQAYCAGVNHGMGGDKQPLEFRLSNTSRSRGPPPTPSPF